MYELIKRNKYVCINQYIQKWRPSSKKTTTITKYIPTQGKRNLWSGSSSAFLKRQRDLQLKPIWTWQRLSVVFVEKNTLIKVELIHSHWNFGFFTNFILQLVNNLIILVTIFHVIMFFLGNTTNFKMHIDSDHGGEFEPKSKSKVQPCLDNFVKSNKPVGKISAERQLTIDDALNKLIIGKVLPVSIVDNIYFKAFVGLLDPRYITIIYEYVYSFFGVNYNYN